jgi:plastocyanin
MQSLMHFRTIVGLTFLLLTPAASHAYEVASPTNGGTIQGRVSYQGRVPMRKIIPTKDQAVCGAPRDEPQVRVGPDKGVQDAVVYLKAVRKGKPWAKPDATPVLDNRNCRFEPAIQVIRAGEIDILNSDPVLHNTHGFYGRRTAFNVALPNKGDKVTSELPRPGMVRVECDAHGWMLAHVFVADSPYYALTGKDGSFSIGDVPPGNYTLVVSQSHLGDYEQAVTVGSGETVKLVIELKKR